MTQATTEDTTKRTPVRKTRGSIASRLVFWFLIIALIPCAILTTITSIVATQALEGAVRNRLVSIAASKADELEVYALQRVRDGTTLARNSTIVDAMKMLTATKTDASDVATNDAMRATLGDAAYAMDFSRLLLMDTTGRVRFALDNSVAVGTSLLEGDLADTELAAGFDRARTLLQAELCGFQLFGVTGEPLAFVTSPIMENGRVIGVLAGGLTPERVWHVLGDLSGLGETGEIVTGERRGANFLMTKPLRLAPDAAFRLEIPFGNAQLGAAVQRGSTGDRGYGMTRDYRGEEVVAAWCYLPSFRWGMAVKQDAAEALALMYLQRQAIIAIGIAVIVGVTLTALIVARTISRPIGTAVRVARQVADGDLRADVGVTADDETGALLQAIQRMSNDLRGLIGSIQQSSSTLLATASSMQATNAGQQQVVTEFGSSSNEAAAAVKEISTTSQELARTMTEVNLMASQTGVRAEEGRVDLTGMDATMKELARSTGSFSAKLAIIDERASLINRVVGTMTKVANQTNLLSLNAALEAERAGKYGLGFRVVAQEISRLADQTAVAALDIEGMVKEMQRSVKAGVDEMHSFSAQVHDGVQKISDISLKLGEIISAVQGISGRFGQVTDGMRAQSQGAEQIREAMVRLSAGAERTASSLNEFNVATTKLHTAVGELNGEVSRFTV
ncbi:MAG: methyl-accepting chemotaxis protein [Planctomycetota bacterium]|nr:MAG: methyl-accepting chemotaxis protein [Planctomycetota bacterium]